jgi:S-(hydroxymethyl)glutathione dehydrogenase/alcohol dehydrogenase
MKAAVLHEVNQPLAIEEVTIRKPGPRQVLIRTRAAGLCHSDLHCMEGLFPTPLPIVLGHESAGVVEQVGSEVTYVKPGDVVITCTSVFCGVCDYCTTGHPVLCQSPDVRIPAAANDLFGWQRTVKLNQFAYLGSFAEQMLVHENAVVKLGRDVPIEIAAIVGCAVVTGYGAVVNSARVGVGESVAVLGCGGVGLAAINTAAISGAGRIIAIDTNPAKLLREKQMRGSVMGSNHFRLDIPRIIDLYVQGRLQLDDWISAKIALKDINDGFAAMEAGKTIRSVIRFD